MAWECPPFLYTGEFTCNFIAFDQDSLTLVRQWRLPVSLVDNKA